LRFIDPKTLPGAASIARPSAASAAQANLIDPPSIDLASELDRLARMPTTPLLFETLCQLYYEYEPDYLVAFVDLVASSFKEVEPQLQARAVKAKAVHTTVLPGGQILPNSQPDNSQSEPPRSFYARAIDVRFWIAANRPILILV